MKWNKKHLILAVLLPIQFLLVQLVSKFPTFIESYYSTGIYPIISKFLRLLFGWIPFSIGDVLLFFLLFIFLRFIYRLFKTRFQFFSHKITYFVAIISILYGCFYLFWGLNYYRKPLSENLGFEQKKYTTQTLFNVTKNIIEQLNAVQIQITKNDSIKVETPYNQQEMYEMAVESYQQLAKNYPQFSYQFPSVKSSLMSLLQSYNGTSGYFNPLTGEAQVNARIPKTSYPTTTCHEMAHQLGFAAENEANFIGFLAANHSNDSYFTYASYRMAFGYCISELRKRDPEKQALLMKSVNSGILKDFKESFDFWEQYQNPFEPLIKKGYDAYLKANNQQKGVDSYNYVVDLLISYFEDELN
ncbi:DUF3810 domain-containing protein [Polaribacter gangjinensis]|uniref:Amino acid permease n=1 Tax=Polaribacter gangjinensis TaxID=574710 RepID=A0A2S7W9X9_9FLAO|nr:DUF3810 domain-containing protein [Polaribacter gangjinensis]PQJ74397.1 hypothetical protein BTO13_03535 [Polaribacter gangjinensis]